MESGEVKTVYKSNEKWDWIPQNKINFVLKEKRVE